LLGYTNRVLPSRIPISPLRVSRVSSSSGSSLASLFASMPRRSSGGRSAPRAARRPAPVRNRPQPVNLQLLICFDAAHQAPPPAPVQGGGSILGGIGSTIAQGMAFGTGSAVAHRAVDAVMGPRTFQHETVASEAPTAAAPANPVNYAGTDACIFHSKAFQNLVCIHSTVHQQLWQCQFYLDMLIECRRGSGAA
ncbi:unnamed protein product, partial [Musa textilis]